MKITLESTEKFVTIWNEDGGNILARVWQGETEGGIPCFALIVRVATEFAKDDPRMAEAIVEFDRELAECAEPRAAVFTLPPHLIL